MRRRGHYARVVDRSDAAEDRKKDDGRDRFEKFVEAANQVVSRGPFFVVILVALVAVGGELPVLVEHHEVGARAAHRVGDPLAAPAGAPRERRPPQPGGDPGEAQRDRRGALRPDGVARPGRPEPRPRRSRSSARPSASRSGTERRARGERLLSPAYAATTVGVFALIAFNAFEAMAVTTVMPTISRELDGRDLYALAFAAPLASGVIGMVAAGAWSDRRGPAGSLIGVAGAVQRGRAGLWRSPRRWRC